MVFWTFFSVPFRHDGLNLGFSKKKSSILAFFGRRTVLWEVFSKKWQNQAFFFLENLRWKPSWRKGSEKKVQKSQVFEKKTSQRQWKSKKKPLGDSGRQRKNLSETVEVLEKTSRRQWKSKKKPLGDSGSLRKNLSETVEVLEKTSRRQWKS